MLLAEYARAVVRHWWLILIAVAIGFVLAVSYSRALPRLFAAESRLIVGQALYGSEAYTDIQAAQELSQTYASLATTRPIIERVAAHLDIDGSLDELRSRVTARADLESVFVTITARDRSPARAAAVADGIAAEVVRLSPVVPGEDAGSPTYRLVSVVESALVPEDPESPRTLLNGLVGGASGLAVALLAVFAIDASGGSVRRYTPLGSRLGLPVLAHLSRGTRAASGPQAPSAGVDVDVLRNRLDYLRLGTDDRVFVLVSPLVGEGRTTVALSLAQCLAGSGRRTLLIDADVRRPSVHTRFGLPNLAGLRTGLWSRRPVTQTPIHEALPNLDVIVSGTSGGDDPISLPPAQTATLIAMARDRYEMVVIDTPALNESRVALQLVPHADGAILVARVDHSDRAALAAAMQLVGDAGGEVVGVVVTDVPESRLRAVVKRLRRPRGGPIDGAERTGGSAPS